MDASQGHQSNADQIAYWNGPSGQRWSDRQAAQDVLLAPVSDILITRIAAQSGARILDVIGGFAGGVVLGEIILEGLDLAERVGGHIGCDRIVEAFVESGRDGAVGEQEAEIVRIRLEEIAVAAVRGEVSSARSPRSTAIRAGSAGRSGHRARGSGIICSTCIPAPIRRSFPC